MITIDNNTKLGTLNGTLLVLFYSIDPKQLFASIVLAGIGAMTSFLVSIFCKWAWEKVKDANDVV